MKVSAETEDKFRLICAGTGKEVQVGVYPAFLLVNFPVDWGKDPHPVYRAVMLAAIF